MLTLILHKSLVLLLELYASFNTDILFFSIGPQMQVGASVRESVTCAHTNASVTDIRIDPLRS